MGSIGAILAAAGFVLASEKIQKMLVPILLSYATGTLLSAALLGLIPEAIESLDGEPHAIMPYILGGLLFFFFLEKFVIWRNCQDETCNVHGSETAGPIILIGDAFHNFTDGIIIASAFLTNFNLGIIVGLTIITHEIPQEAGDFGILLNGGYSRKKAFTYNLLSSSTTIPSAIIGYFVLGAISSMVPYLLAISAASFLYIALSDLTPNLHEKVGYKHIIRQFILIMAGVGTMVLVLTLFGHQH